jgi:hypothetical protein
LRQPTEPPGLFVEQIEATAADYWSDSD